MIIRSTLFVISWGLTVAACSGGGSGGSGESFERFVAGCDTSTNLGKAFCDCAGKNARKKLSADGFAFLAATFDGNEAELARLRDGLGPADAIEASMFMVNAYKDCAPSE